MRLKLRKITSVSVKNSSFISEVFQTEDSGALLHSRGKLHKQKCFSAGSQKGDHFLWSSYVLSAQNIHFNDWEKYLLHRLSISNKGYICSSSFTWKGRTNRSCLQRVRKRWPEFFGVCMCCVLKVFTSTIGKNTSFIGKVFQTKDTVAQLLSQPKNNSWSRLVHEPEPDFWGLICINW